MNPIMLFVTVSRSSWTGRRCRDD